MKDRIYLCIDLKSFYASVECIERGLDAMTTNLVVADKGRTEKTICLAVSPSLKSIGIPGRPRLFEVVQTVRRENQKRLKNAPGRRFAGESFDINELSHNSGLGISYITAPPRMAHYVKYSTDIYKVYLKYVAPEDIHVYSIDEVFMDITDYLLTAGKTPREFAMAIIKDVLDTVGITATAGIGTNMYLAKVAMDIMAKHTQADENGVRIAELDEMTYREKLWNHKPLTDFWRVGKGYLKRLEMMGLETMGDIARASLNSYGEDKLYKAFGINAELLIDHAWGWEPCTMADVKAYRPETGSISSGQVLHCPYDFKKAKMVVREMTELLVLDLVDRNLVAKQMVLTVGYDIENLKSGSQYQGETVKDSYGRIIPKQAHGTVSFDKPTSSTKQIVGAVQGLFDEIVDKNLLVRRLNVVAGNVVDREEAAEKNRYEQLDLFTDYEEQERQRKKEEEDMEKERGIQEALLNIKKRYGKNAVIKGTNLKEGATAIERNKQIGGHKA